MQEGGTIYSKDNGYREDYRELMLERQIIKKIGTIAIGLAGFVGFLFPILGICMIRGLDINTAKVLSTLAGVAAGGLLSAGFSRLASQRRITNSPLR